MERRFLAQWTVIHGKAFGWRKHGIVWVDEDVIGVENIPIAPVYLHKICHGKMHIRIGYISTALLPSENRFENRFNLRNRHLNIPQTRSRLAQVHQLVKPIRIIRPNPRTKARSRQRRLLTPPLLRIRGMCIRPVILLYGWIGAWHCRYRYRNQCRFSSSLAILAIPWSATPTGDIEATRILADAIHAWILAIAADS